MNQTITIITYTILIGVVLAFLLCAWRDLMLLVRRPRGLGIGFERVWALGRTAMAEGWAARAWALPILWLLASLGINQLVQPHADDERERMSLYLTVLLRGQEYLLLIFVLVLACFSLPRERERRTIITTAAKPISRLELYLGKVVGFATLAAMLLVVMGGVSYGYLLVADQIGKSRTWAKYQRMDADFRKGIAGASLPPEGLRMDAEQGVLEANNFVAPFGPMQVAGRILYQGDKAQRFLKGGSAERLVYKFDELWGLEGGGNPNPYFYFVFFAYPMQEGQAMPTSIDLRVTVAPERNVTQTGIHEATVALNSDADMPGVYKGRWQPDPIGLISGSKGGGAFGRVQMQIMCDTPNIYLQVIDVDAKASQSNVYVDNLDPRFGGRALAPVASPRIFGFEKYDKQQVEGPPSAEVRPQTFEGATAQQVDDYGRSLEVAHFRFKLDDVRRQVRLTKNPQTGELSFSLAMYLDVDKQANNTWPTVASVTAYNQYGKLEDAAVTAVTVAEKRLTEVRLPATLLSGGGDLLIDLRCLTPGHWIGANNLSVRLPQAQTPFVWNLIKSELVIFLEATLLAAIAVAMSMRLGGAVAMLVTSVCYVLGNLIPFVLESAENGVNTFLNPVEQRELSGSWSYTIFSVVYGGMMKAVVLVVKMLPDFRIFDPLGYIVQWRNMPLGELLVTSGWTFLYALPFLALAYLLARKQELA